jgi:hypothetical protein
LGGGTLLTNAPFTGGENLPPCPETRASYESKQALLLEGEEGEPCSGRPITFVKKYLSMSVLTSFLPMVYGDDRIEAK